MQIIAIHSNNFDTLSSLFGRKEPITTDELLIFKDIFRINFEIYKTVNVNGPYSHPVFKYLKHSLEGFFDNSIKWNFSKFLINHKGIPTERFSAFDNYFDVEASIRKLLDD